eukprot:TRINITY_DN1806_c3_g1_i2.p2 TRINITY_DN1806_c3_g1~~TRINITY_DN1806_c3_g1_i2.p2  ORF type:complete len:137 (+),score=29.15 TRINITY_DN1806_c3_g1_i2:770-1180(+)
MTRTSSSNPIILLITLFTLFLLTHITHAGPFGTSSGGSALHSPIASRFPLKSHIVNLPMEMVSSSSSSSSLLHLLSLHLTPSPSLPPSLLSIQNHEYVPYSETTKPDPEQVPDMFLETPSLPDGKSIDSSSSLPCY